MSVDALRRIREKYPQYADLADEDLARRILARYPQYQDLLGGIVRASAAPRGTYLSGGALEKIFDVLRTGEYAVGGALSRRPAESLGQAALRGIREREESGPQFARHLQALGAPDSFWTDAVAFGASLTLDPINLIGIGLPGKGLRAIGAARAATAIEQVPARLAAPVARAATTVAEHVAPGAVAATRGRRLLEPILEQQAIREAKGVEQVMDLGKALRTDATRLTRTAKDARRLDQAVGLYFDAGADTMMGHISQAAQVTPEVMATARAAANTAQQAFLRNLDQGTRSFVEKWAPRLASEDAALAENLVRVGMLKPETAAKWEGIHLRRIYQKYEDPAAFVEFLERSDPVEAARLLGRLERGIPITRTGAPIPTGLTKARQLLTEEVRGGLGEIREASSRYVAGGTMAERAIARGEAFQKIAQQFAIDEDMVRGFARATELFRQMPDTAGWGALAGKWLPKEIADPLLRAMKRPEGLDRVIQTLVGWWKVSKVILNPATHARNIRTNIALVHNKIGLGGLNPATWARAVREVLTNGPMFREAKATSTAFINTFTNTEIRRFIGDLGRARGPVDALTAPFRAVVSTMSRAYNVEEQVGKMTVYLTARGRGLSPEAAGLLAEKTLYNYGKVPPLIDKARRYGFYPFACVDPETEILSARGWLSHDALRIGDEVLSFNMEQQAYEWKPVVSITRTHYAGPMVSIRSRTLNMLLTPNHRTVVYRPNNVPGDFRILGPQFVEAQNLLPHYRIPLAADYTGAPPIYDDDFVRLVGWIFAEGWISWQRWNTRTYPQVGFCQSEDQAEQTREWLTDAFPDLWTEQTREQDTTINGHTYTKVRTVYFRLRNSFARSVVRVLTPEKRLTMPFLRSLSGRQLRILRDVILQADGSVSGAQSVISQHIKRANDIAALLVLCGDSFGEQRPTATQRTFTLRKGRHATLRHAIIDRVPYDGLVWCPTVADNETWIARRRGKVFITGNTFPYKVATETLPAIVRRPGRAAQQVKVAAALGTEPPPEEARVLPQQMRGGNFIRLPWKDARGRPLYYDITYEYYFGDIAESGTPPGQLAKLLRGEARGLEAVAPLLTPVGQLVAEIVLNKSLFTGQELQRKGETAARGAARQALRTALPGGAFALGEIALAKAGLEPEPTTPLARAVTGTPTRLGEAPPSIPQAAAQTFAGLRIMPLDVAAQRRRRVMELEGAIRDIRAEMASVARNPAYKPNVRARKLEELRQRLRQVVAEYHREGAIRRP